jgi:hypothetical protein
MRLPTIVHMKEPVLVELDERRRVSLGKIADPEHSRDPVCEHPIKEEQLTGQDPDLEAVSRILVCDRVRRKLGPLEPPRGEILEPEEARACSRIDQSG